MGFVGFDGIGAECVDGDSFVGVIAIPEGLGWGISLRIEAWLARW